MNKLSPEDDLAKKIYEEAWQNSFFLRAPHKVDKCLVEATSANISDFDRTSSSQIFLKFIHY